MIEVLKPGLLTTPQDLGRVGFSHLGVGRAGAFDLPALRLANALAGNARDACALEITLLGPTLLFHHDARIALTGAPLPARVDDVECAMWSPLAIHAGQTLTLGPTRTGCRAYLAIRGGFDFAPVLGSRSLDVNAALGPLGPPLRAGDMLPIREIDEEKSQTEAAFGVQHWSIDPRPWFDVESPLRLLPGTHAPLLDPDSRAALVAQEFRVGNDSNRVGLRLQGTLLQLTTSVELISEACIAGTLQLPPSGEPIALGVEHPVSGGYARIGQIAAVDLPRLAQRRPGDTLRFVSCTLNQAQRALRERELALSELENTIRQRLAEQTSFPRKRESSDF